ncbi:MAG: CoA pyrophosphatase [Actinomycetota bacterium]|nr:CoA pyrophosphatase [Actinomycetota bacterium]
MTDRVAPAAVELPGAAAAPGWLHLLIANATSRALPGAVAGLPADHAGRHSAVLILFSDGADSDGPDVLITARAGTLRDHGGQPAFPGGRSDPGEDPVRTALREAQEETGLDPASVNPILRLPELFLGHSDFRVVPIVGYWHTPGPVWAVDPAETAAVVRIPIASLTDPARRGRVRLTAGRLGAAFDVAGLVIWGFTGGLLDAVLELGGWNRPWLPGRDLSLPESDAAWAIHAEAVNSVGAQRSGNRE